MRERKKSALRSMLEIGALFLMAAFTLSFALIHFDNEDSHNTYTIIGEIANVDSVWRRQSSGLITFEVGGINCYYNLEDAGWDYRELCYDRYKKLEISKEIVTAIITEDLDTDSYRYGLRVIGIDGENGNCFSLDSHNRRQTSARVFFCTITIPVIVLTLYAQIAVLRREIILPAKKRKMRKQKKLEQQGNKEQSPSKQESNALKQKKPPKHNKRN